MLNLILFFSNVFMIKFDYIFIQHIEGNLSYSDIEKNFL